MSVIFYFWIALGLSITVVWLRRHGDISRAVHRASMLTPDLFLDAAPASPRVSVVVAARNEESNIERCIRSLVDQDYPDLQIIAVNDRSEDRTGAILAELQRSSPQRLNVVTVTETRPGWHGKVNAVHTGMASADGAYLVFTDADCVQRSNRSITVALRYAVEHDIEFLSVIPVVAPACIWEAIVQPVAAGVLMFWNPPERVNDPRRPEAYANGAFMLLERRAYERIGGHEAVRDALCEDMQLARIAKAAGVRLHVVQNRGLYETRMYETLRETWRGWSRILQGSLERPARVMLAAVVLSIISLGPWASLIGLGVAGGAAGAVGSSWGVPLAVWTLAAGAQLSVMFRFYPLVSAPPRRALTYPLGALALLAILLDAWLKLLGLGATVWSGRSYGTPANGAR